MKSNIFRHLFLADIGPILISMLHISEMLISDQNSSRVSTAVCCCVQLIVICSYD